jgi:hypothetical protein
MATKTRVVLDLNTRVKVIHASERDKLSVKQIMKMFNIGKTQVYEILMKKTEILMWWENCGNGKIKRELKKTANEDEVTGSVENENDQQDLQNCMNEAVFSNCDSEDYFKIY